MCFVQFLVKIVFLLNVSKSPFLENGENSPFSQKVTLWENG